MTTQLCDNKECQCELTDDLSIFIWEKDGDEITICEDCHQDCQEQLAGEGWTEAE